MAWGVRPAALLGHSLGEYVAACLAGVFSLDDALALVAERGRLMSSWSPGRCSPCRCPRRRSGRCSAGLSLAAVNGPSRSVVSGRAPSRRRAARLAAQGLRCRRLHTSHAFHSAMMEPVLEPFAERARRVRLPPPAIPFLSNLTGTWITAGEATDPDYWARHLAAPCASPTASPRCWPSPAACCWRWARARRWPRWRGQPAPVPPRRCRTRRTGGPTRRAARPWAGSGSPASRSTGGLPRRRAPPPGAAADLSLRAPALLVQGGRPGSAASRHRRAAESHRRRGRPRRLRPARAAAATGAADRARARGGRHLGGSARDRPGRGPRRLLRAGRALAAGHPAPLAPAGRVASTCRSRPFRDADRGGPGRAVSRPRPGTRPDAGGAAPDLRGAPRRGRLPALLRAGADVVPAAAGPGKRGLQPPRPTSPCPARSTRRPWSARSTRSCGATRSCAPTFVGGEGRPARSSAAGCASRCRRGPDGRCPPRAAGGRRPSACDRRRMRRPFDLAPGPLFRPVLLRRLAEHAASLLVTHAPHRDRRLVDALLVRECAALYRGVLPRDGRPPLPGACHPVRRLRRLAARSWLHGERSTSAARLLDASSSRACRRCSSCRPTGRGRACRACRGARPRLRAPGGRLAHGARSSAAAGGDALHDPARRLRGAALRATPAQDDVRRRHADRQPQPRGDRAADRLLRQHPGAAHRRAAATRASASCWAGCARSRSAPSRTRTCRSRSWSRSCGPSAPQPLAALPGDVRPPERAGTAARGAGARPAAGRRRPQPSAQVDRHASTCARQLAKATRLRRLPGVQHRPLRRRDGRAHGRPPRRPARPVRRGRPGAASRQPCRCSTRAERRQLLAEWNALGRSRPRGLLIHELFAAQAARGAGGARGRPAAGGRLTYGELDGALEPAGPPSARVGASGRRCAVGALRWSARRRWWWPCSACSRPAAPTCRSTRAYPRERLACCWRTPRRAVLVTEERSARRACRRTARTPCASIATARRPSRASRARPPAHGRRRRTWPTSSTPRARPAGPRACRCRTARSSTSCSPMLQRPGLAPRPTCCSR